VAAELDHSESPLPRELLGDQEALREVEMGQDSGSELSELESCVVGAMEVEEKTGRPRFGRAAPGARQQQSTRGFFRRGNRNGHGNGARDVDDIFATPGKQAMGGALVLSLSAAATNCPQQVGTAETLNSAKDFGRGGWRFDVGAEDWAEETANEDEMEGFFCFV